MILLFDTSHSMRPVVARVAEAAHMAMGELRPGDRVAVMAFDRTTTSRRGFHRRFCRRRAGHLWQGAPAQKPLLQPDSVCCWGCRPPVSEAAFSEPAGPQPPPGDRGHYRRSGHQRAALRAARSSGGGRHRTRSNREPRAQGTPLAFWYRGIRDFAIKTGGDMLNTRDAAGRGCGRC